jgi:hypothetical protein
MGSIPGASHPIGEYTEIKDERRMPVEPPFVARLPLTLVAPTG